ncbi:restriction endonuclease subunit S [Pseudidiomarina atlantica]|uniref:restriction endonuclease subunit S n=1 Tax=Pseudidiomarina atlantica TaxID=1517416 RepID=UPI0006921343|nr:restriction endonuclease subunit S [Pseudidiomarina atlantica]
MSFEIASSQLSEFLLFKNGKSSPERDENGNFPVFGSNGLIGHANKSNSNSDTIIIGRVGSYCGSIHYSQRPCWVTDNAMICTSKNPEDSLFWYYYLLSANLNQYRSGSGQPLLNQSTMNSINCKVPKTLTERVRIGKLLASFDRLVSQNNRINQTLEQIAQAIFKSWFVDFEPVKAKINALEAGGSDEDALLAAMQAISGKDKEQLTQLQTENPEHYNQLRTTAELFPSAMQDSELGEIPEGWSCLALDEIAKYQNGLALQKFRPTADEDWLPVVKIAQLKKGFADGQERATATIKPDCIIENGDVVFSWSGSLMIDTWCGGRAALNQHLFKVTSQDYPKWLFFHLTRHHLEEFQRIAADKAVTMGHIKREHLKQALCAVPDTKLLDAVGIALGTMLEKQITLRLESDSLKQIQDTLLPRLLSGDLNFLEASEEFSNEQFHKELS